MPNSVHEIINNRYVTIKNIGSGGYSTIWLSYDNIQKQYCALKIHNENDDDEQVGRREAKFCEIISQLRCPFIIKYYESFMHDNKMCIAYELLGLSLYTIIHTSSEGIHPTKVIKYTEQILKALCALHKQNIIHGDVKPENMLLCSANDTHKQIFDKLDLNKNTKIKTTTLLDKIKKIFPQTCESDESDECESDGEYKKSNSFDNDISDCESVMTVDSYTTNDSENETQTTNTICYDLDNIVKLADFGHAVHPSQKKYKKHVQTYYYRSPEELLELGYTMQSDMWALGCSIYELLTGKILFDPSSYDGNEERHHLFLITQKIGYYSNKMINDSPKKDIIFTHDGKMIKGYDSFVFEPLMTDIEAIYVTYNINHKCKELLKKLLMGCLSITPDERLTSEQCLILFNH